MSLAAVAALLSLALPDPPGLVARIGTTAFRQCGQILSISADGRRLYNNTPSFRFVLDDRGVMSVTDAEIGVTLSTFPTLTYGERAISSEFAPEGLRMLVLDPHTERVRLRVVDPDTGLVLRKGKTWTNPGGDGPVLPYDVQLFGRAYACYHDDKTTSLLDPETGRLTTFDPPLAHNDRIKDTSLDGRVCVVNLNGGGIRVYDLPTGKRRAEWAKDGNLDPDAHGFHSEAIAFTPDGRHLVVWSAWMKEGRSLELRDVDGKVVRVLLENQGANSWVVFDPNGKTFACRNTNRDFADDTCEIREWATGRRVARIPDCRTLGGYRYSPDGKTLWNGDSPPVPFDVATGRVRAGAPYPPGRVYPFQFRADGDLIGVAGETVFMWYARKGQERSRDPRPSSLGWQHVAFERSGERLQCRSSRGAEAVWDFRSLPKPESARRADPKPADGKGWMHNEWLHLRREEEELIVRVLPGGKAGERPQPGVWRVPLNFDITRTYLAPGGKCLIVGDFRHMGGWPQPTVQFAIIDLTDPNSTATFGSTERGPGSDAQPEFSPDGRWMAFVYQAIWREPRRDYIRIFDLKTRRQVTKIDLPWTLLSGCVFSPDSRTLAVSGHHDVTLIETATWKVRATVRPPRDMGTGPSGNPVQWSPGNRLFATITHDGRIAVWDVACVAPAFSGTLADAWDALSKPDAAVAFAAMKRLAADPENAVRLIRSMPLPVGVRTVRAVETVAWMRQWDAFRLLEFWSVRFCNRDLAREAWLALGRLHTLEHGDP